MDDSDLKSDVFNEDIEVIYLDEDEIIEDSVDNEDENDDGYNFDNAINLNDLAQLTFTKHTKSVFSCDLSKNKQLAVTGSEDDCAYVWLTSNGEILFECTGHKDSVTEVCFNYNNQLVATGDMSGMIQVWNITDKKLIWCYEGDDMEWLMWHPVINILISGNQAGDINIWQIPQGNCKILPSVGSPCTCGTILPDGKSLITGYNDGQVKLWDIKINNVVWQLNKVEDFGITSLVINSTGTLVSVAPSSNLIKLVDGKIIGKFMLNDQNEIETSLFIKELDVLVTGSISGHLCVWDVSRQKLRHEAKLTSAVTIMKQVNNDKIIIGSSDGTIYICDVKTCVVLKTLSGHKSEILSLSVSDDGLMILSTSDDGTAKIFEMNST